MTNDKGILIKNIYYMLLYAFQLLKQEDYANVAVENFEHTHDLFAEILKIGITRQLKQGLYREYISKNENLTVMHGKLDINETIKNKLQKKTLLSCNYDELSENNIYNQILKTTIYFLLTSGKLKAERKKKLKRLYIYFGNIDFISVNLIDWSRIIYKQNNRNYEILLNICRIVLEGMLQTTDEGNYWLAEFSDEYMAKVYEKFILEYYRQTYNNISVKANQVKWNLIGEHDKNSLSFLPKMQTDITLYDKNTGKTLIIDAKYYGKILNDYYGKSTFHSANIYQIFTYVKNMDKNDTKNVAGMLLYAKTSEDIIFDNCKYNMGGSIIFAETLNLNQDFRKITGQLDTIIKNFFEIRCCNGKM